MAKTGTAGAAVLAAAALVVAACGGGGYQSTVSAKRESASGALTIKTKSGSPGTYLTDGSGRSIYLWMADSGGKSSCTGACAQAWPPLTSKGKPTAGSGVKPADLGAVARAGGAKQVTYQGHPLYYYAGDSGPGTTTGEGSDDFGAKWWLVAPTGAAVKSSGSSGDADGAWG
jgi:predicted lipoprotein with Yx(FWY)xxD motif